MSTLVDFLRARIDEDEAAALATLSITRRANLQRGIEPPRWVRNGMKIYDADPFPPIVRVEHTWPSEAEHITRHDPARVLADVEAKRRILELHESWPVLVEQPPVMKFAEGVENLAVSMSQQMAWLTTKEYRARFGDEPPTSAILRALALSYAGHPDYRKEEWCP
jgi:hypothetical protein